MHVLGSETVVKIDIAGEEFTAKGLMILEKGWVRESESQRVRESESRRVGESESRRVRESESQRVRECPSSRLAFALLERRHMWHS